MIWDLLEHKLEVLGETLNGHEESLNVAANLRPDIRFEQRDKDPFLALLLEKMMTYDTRRQKALHRKRLREEIEKEQEQQQQQPQPLINDSDVDDADADDGEEEDDKDEKEETQEEGEERERRDEPEKERKEEREQNTAGFLSRSSFPISPHLNEGCVSSPSSLRPFKRLRTAFLEDNSNDISSSLSFETNFQLNEETKFDHQQMPIKLYNEDQITTDDTFLKRVTTKLKAFAYRQEEHTSLTPPNTNSINTNNTTTNTNITTTNINTNKNSDNSYMLLFRIGLNNTVQNETNQSEKVECCEMKRSPHNSDRSAHEKLKRFLFRGVTTDT
jgi:hypothetical protein